MNAPTGSPVKATANGTRKIASTSKIRKMMAVEIVLRMELDLRFA